MIFDFVSENLSLWLCKKVLVISIRVQRASCDLPSIIMSSAKNRVATLVVSRSRLRPNWVELSSCPRVDMKRLNIRGERLQPEHLGSLKLH